MSLDNARTIALSLTAVILLSGCDEAQSPHTSRHTEQREVEPFKAIDLRGDARLEITVGKDETLVLEGPEASMRRISTRVRGDTLHIRSKRDWLWTDGDPRVTIRITVPRLEALELRGGNDARLAGFSGGTSRIRIEGAAHIEATGRLDQLTVRMSGAGHADLSRLVANKASVTVDGVGRVYVNSLESLDATMNGVGAILYSGNPRVVNTSMNGLGTIARRDGASQRRASDGRRASHPDVSERERRRLLERVESTEVI
jgi:hypothetical protein